MTEDQRVAIGLLETGLFVPAKREQIRPRLEAVLNTYLEVVGSEVTAQKDQLRKELLAKLDPSEREAVSPSV